MGSQSLPKLTAARRAARAYLRDSAKARDSQYEFLAITYLAYQEALRCPRAYRESMEKRLRRKPSGPEQKRPFLLLLHALLGTEDGIPRDVLPKFSKLTTALEELDRAFSGTKPSRPELKSYIIDAGGIAGLYDLSRLGEQEHGENSQERERSAPSANVVPMNPSDIQLPALRGHVTKVGRGYRLRLSEFSPGEYSVRIRVGKGGFVQAILDPDVSDEDAA